VGDCDCDYDCSMCCSFVRSFVRWFVVVDELRSLAASFDVPSFLCSFFRWLAGWLAGGFLGVPFPCAERGGVHSGCMC